jgi:hypothetical protein
MGAKISAGYHLKLNQRERERERERERTRHAGYEI